MFGFADQPPVPCRHALCSVLRRSARVTSWRPVKPLSRDCQSSHSLVSPAGVAARLTRARGWLLTREPVRCLRGGFCRNPGEDALKAQTRSRVQLFYGSTQRFSPNKPGRDGLRTEDRRVPDRPFPSPGATCLRWERHWPIATARYPSSRSLVPFSPLRAGATPGKYSSRTETFHIGVLDPRRVLSAPLRSDARTIANGVVTTSPH